MSARIRPGCMALVDMATRIDGTLERQTFLVTHVTLSDAGGANLSGVRRTPDGQVEYMTMRSAIDGNAGVLHEPGSQPALAYMAGLLAAGDLSARTAARLGELVELNRLERIRQVIGSLRFDPAETVTQQKADAFEVVASIAQEGVTQ